MTIKSTPYDFCWYFCNAWWWYCLKFYTIVKKSNIHSLAKFDRNILLESDKIVLFQPTQHLFLGILSVIFTDHRFVALKRARLEKSQFVGDEMNSQTWRLKKLLQMLGALEWPPRAATTRQSNTWWSSPTPYWCILVAALPRLPARRL